MKSNFAFLEKDIDTQGWFATAKDAEELYTQGKFDIEFESIRKIIENVARTILDLEYVTMPERSTFNDCLRAIRKKNLVDKKILDAFYGLKQLGNKAAHTLDKYSKTDALDGLKKLNLILCWYMNHHTDEQVDDSLFKEPEESAKNLYQTAERKLIYVQTADNKNGMWPAYIGLEKIGDASVDGFEMDNRPNSDDLRRAADRRINEYMKTAGVPHKLQWAELAYRKKDHSWFRDYDVHDVLERSGIKKTAVTAGNEWYKSDLETAKRAIQAVKEGKRSLDAPAAPTVKIVLRPEQKDAVNKTEKTFKHKDRMLWNAKMRFGKTLSALQLIKNGNYHHVLIMTHRPVVDEGWLKDFQKIGMSEAGYLYGSKKKGQDFNYLAKSDKPFVYFASLQDLSGSEAAGGKVGDKNQQLFHTDWNLVIIDEAHEGTQTELANNVTKLVVKEGHTKLLELSGTPFNILDQYDEDQVYTWDYVMEQKAKYQWSKDHPHERNPYEGLPKVNMYTFEMNKHFNDVRFTDGAKAFNFKEFFRVDDNGQFVYHDKVKQFLNNISSPDSRTNYPYSTKEFRNRLRHTLWIMPGVKEANALEDMLHNDPVFGMEYKIVNVVRDGDNEGIASETDVDRVNKAIGKYPEATKTITLTVRKLTTGVTIKPWTGVIFLSNTNSAMQYLQAAFRAQTPYSSPTFGMKTNCYIFDFAPDRALKVMAASTQLNIGVGKRTSIVQKDKMNELLNFLPIIGEQGQGMKPYKVDSMLAQIKRVYAEKAVKTGFDDDSLYSDELLMLKDADLKEFNDLKAIVGTTKSEKKPLKVDINHQGLTDEEYDDALNGQKRKPRERTPEEQAVMDKMKQLKKQRKTMISILRSISIRIPMMIYGMDVKLSDDVSVNNFVKNIDAQSWKEFMPNGVTKELFRKFSKYYDQDVFVEAGRIIRHKVKELDSYDPIERTEKLAAIFGTFRNPDKETVLTPWRVVNLHLGKTIGGLSFFDEDYQYSTQDGVSANRWVDAEYTDQVFKPDTHILEINSKTGLYPLYVGMSLYWQEFQKLNNDTAGKFSSEDQLMIWQRILRENLFLVAKTPMAKAIAQRTLAGYQDLDVNVEFVDNIVADAKADAEKEAEKIRGLFGNMNFDVVIGNPPYQETKEGTSDTPIYPQFMDLSYELSTLAVLITPARFLFNAGKTPTSWNKKMLEMEHLKVVMYEPNSSRVFPRTDIKGGIAITLYDATKQFGPIGVFTPFKALSSIAKKARPLDTYHSLSSIIYLQNRFNLKQLYKDYPEEKSKISSGGREKRIVSSSFSKLDVFSDTCESDKDIRVLGIVKANQRAYKWINIKYIAQDNGNLSTYKVLVPKSNGSGALGETLSTPLIGEPLIGFTQSFLGIGKFNTVGEANACLKYVKSKFARVLLGILKVTQDNPPEKWRMIPMQDFTPNSDIDWSKSIPEIDQQLYKKYNLSEDEINFIETKVQTMK